MNRLAALFAAVALLVPATAAADVFTVWAAAKGDYVGGTGDVYTRFDEPVGLGAEAGFEVLFIDLWGEALILGEQQYLFTINAGFDLTFGDETRVVLGLFTGPMFFGFPEQKTEELAISGEARQALTDAGVSEGDIDAIEDTYNTTLDDQEELSKFAVGWNVARVQLNIEFELMPVLWFGIGGEAGYHFLLSGEDAASGAKNTAIDDVEREHELPSEATDALRDEVGAEEVDPDSLDGLNFQAGVYLKLEL